MRSLPLSMVGGSVFGRYPKISTEQTWNMIISDGWSVPYAGYRNVTQNSPTGEGRGIYGSVRAGKMFAVINDVVYQLNGNSQDTTFDPVLIGKIKSFSGEVYFAENNANQIAICDGQGIYIYNYSTGAFVQASITFIPVYISFQDGYFLAATPSNQTGSYPWRLSALNDGTVWIDSANTDGTFQTKPNNCIAVVPVPGQEGVIYVFGQSVTESWYNTGAQLFPYQRSYYNNDYGCVSAATIANLDNMLVWLAGNEKSGPFIMYSSGGKTQKISTDGIDFKLSNLAEPTQSYAFLFRQDGHLIYQISFTNAADNFSLAFDFNSGKFLNTCDNEMNFHIAKRVIFFNNNYYFISFIDGDIYELSSTIYTFNGAEIPRIRITPTIRLPDSSPFIGKSLNFPIEQGMSKTIQRVDLSVSMNGGVNFGSTDRIELNPLGKPINRFEYWDLGYSNEFVAQFRFWGRERFVYTDGEINIQQ